MTSLVYETHVDTMEDLLARVQGAAQEKMIRRCNVCNELGGRHIEPLL